MSISSSAPWTAFYGSTPVSLHYPQNTMYAMVRRTAGTCPRRTAHTFMGKATTYAAFLSRIDDAAKGLQALGIGSGDHVSICMPNMPQTLECFYALNRIGAVANMIHPLSAPEEIAFYLNFSSSKAVLTLDQFSEKIFSIRSHLQKSVAIMLCSAGDALPFHKKLVYPFTESGRRMPAGDYIRWSDVLSRGRKAPALSEPAANAAACAAVLYSGGTTGTPKGVALSNLNFNALALQTIAASGCESIAGMKMLSIMPVFHGFGLGIGVHTALAGGATCILVPRFDSGVYAKTLKRQKPQLICGVPALFESLLSAKGLAHTDLGFLRGIFCGGDSLSPRLKQRVNDFLRRHHCAEQIREGYGTTECVTASCLMPRGMDRPSCVGIPFPDTFYKIVRVRTETEAAPLAAGEICISGPTVMSGYLHNPRETAAVLRRHADGKIWLHTGDLGYMDGDGFVYFLQRIKRVIVSSGYNIYPAQLENIINSLPDVQLSCVIGVPDSRRGQRVKAYVIPASGIAPDDDLRREILNRCKEAVAAYALPREIEFRSSLPKTPLGKVAYRQLEQEAGSI